VDAAYIIELGTLVRKLRRLTDDLKSELKREDLAKATKLADEIDRLGRKLRTLAETMAAIES
jgi:protein-arginine kinase activator protein McsA